MVDLPGYPTSHGPPIRMGTIGQKFFLRALFVWNFWAKLFFSCTRMNIKKKIKSACGHMVTQSLTQSHVPQCLSRCLDSAPKRRRNSLSKPIVDSSLKRKKCVHVTKDSFDFCILQHTVTVFCGRTQPPPRPICMTIGQNFNFFLFSEKYFVCCSYGFFGPEFFFLH